MCSVANRNLFHCCTYAYTLIITKNNRPRMLSRSQVTDPSKLVCRCRRVHSSEILNSCWRSQIRHVLRRTRCKVPASRYSSARSYMPSSPKPAKSRRTKRSFCVTHSAGGVRERLTCAARTSSPSPQLRHLSRRTKLQHQRSSAARIRSIKIATV